MTRPASWWIAELGRVGYSSGEPLGGTFPRHLETFLRAVAVFALALCAAPIVLVLRGAPPLGLVGILCPLPFAMLAWARAKSLARPLRLTSDGLLRVDGTTIAWDRIQSIRITPREISIVWDEPDGSIGRTVRPRRRDVGDLRIDAATLPPAHR